LHLDPVRARRYKFGSTLIHGLNGSLRAIDLATSKMVNPIMLREISIQFVKPVFQEETVEVFIGKLSVDKISIELHKDGKRVQIIDISFEVLKDTTPNMRYSTYWKGGLANPQELLIEDIGDLRGELKLQWDELAFEAVFPSLKKMIPDVQCSTLLGTTKIVGMICPGLNSVYASLRLKFRASSENSVSSLNYRVVSSDARFSRVVMSIHNSVGEGEIEAFFRPPPVQQATYTSICGLLNDNRFAGRNALIIGGSRGIGEVIAKLLAAGGANSVITYANGKEDADCVEKEITQSGGCCKVVPYNVLSGERNIVFNAFEGMITHIYYLASPLVGKSDSALWDHAAFSNYCRYYVQGLADLLAPLVQNKDYRRSDLAIFVPSTVFLNEAGQGFGEYVAAKSAAEVFCTQVRLKCPSWTLEVPRLPRLLTDQTSAVVNARPLETAKTILEYL
ncbi:MAG: hypothetical protein DRR42_18505, partial [Gammaproteobacteria bacterium]